MSLIDGESEDASGIHVKLDSDEGEYEGSSSDFGVSFNVSHISHHEEEGEDPEEFDADGDGDGQGGHPELYTTQQTDEAGTDDSPLLPSDDSLLSQDDPLPLSSSAAAAAELGDGGWSLPAHLSMDDTMSRRQDEHSHADDDTSVTTAAGGIEDHSLPSSPSSFTHPTTSITDTATATSTSAATTLHADTDADAQSTHSPAPAPAPARRSQPSALQVERARLREHHQKINDELSGSTSMVDVMTNAVEEKVQHTGRSTPSETSSSSASHHQVQRESQTSPHRSPSIPKLPLASLLQQQHDQPAGNSTRAAPLPALHMDDLSSSPSPSPPPRMDNRSHKALHPYSSLTARPSSSSSPPSSLVTSSSSSMYAFSGSLSARGPGHSRLNAFNQRLKAARKIQHWWRQMIPCIPAKRQLRWMKRQQQRQQQQRQTQHEDELAATIPRAAYNRSSSATAAPANISAPLPSSRPPSSQPVGASMSKRSLAHLKGKMSSLRSARGSAGGGGGGNGAVETATGGGSSSRSSVSPSPLSVRSPISSPASYRRMTSASFPARARPKLRAVVSGFIVRNILAQTRTRTIIQQIRDVEVLIRDVEEELRHDNASVHAQGSHQRPATSGIPQRYSVTFLRSLQQEHTTLKNKFVALFDPPADVRSSASALPSPLSSPSFQSFPSRLRFGPAPPSRLAFHPESSPLPPPPPPPTSSLPSAFGESVNVNGSDYVPSSARRSMAAAAAAVPMLKRKSQRRYLRKRTPSLPPSTHDTNTNRIDTRSISPSHSPSPSPSPFYSASASPPAAYAASRPTRPYSARPSSARSSAAARLPADRWHALAAAADGHDDEDELSSYFQPSSSPPVGHAVPGLHLGADAGSKIGAARPQSARSSHIRPSSSRPPHANAAYAPPPPSTARSSARPSTARGLGGKASRHIILEAKPMDLSRVRSRVDVSSPYKVPPMEEWSDSPAATASAGMGMGMAFDFGQHDSFQQPSAREVVGGGGGGAARSKKSSKSNIGSSAAAASRPRHHKRKPSSRVPQETTLHSPSREDMHELQTRLEELEVAEAEKEWHRMFRKPATQQQPSQDHDNQHHQQQHQQQQQQQQPQRQQPQSQAQPESLYPIVEPAAPRSRRSSISSRRTSIMKQYAFGGSDFEDEEDDLAAAFPVHHENVTDGTEEDDSYDAPDEYAAPIQPAGARRTSAGVGAFAAFSPPLSPSSSSNNHQRRSSMGSHGRSAAPALPLSRLVESAQPSQNHPSNDHRPTSTHRSPPSPHHHRAATASAYDRIRERDIEEIEQNLADIDALAALSESRRRALALSLRTPWDDAENGNADGGHRSVRSPSSKTARSSHVHEAVTRPSIVRPHTARPFVHSPSSAARADADHGATHTSAADDDLPEEWSRVVSPEEAALPIVSHDAARFSPSHARFIQNDRPRPSPSGSSKTSSHSSSTPQLRDGVWGLTQQFDELSREVESFMSQPTQPNSPVPAAGGRGGGGYATHR